MPNVLKVTLAYRNHLGHEYSNWLQPPASVGSPSVPVTSAAEVRCLSSIQELLPAWIPLVGLPNRDILKFPGFLCKCTHHRGFISFQTRPIQDLSAPFLGGWVIFFLDKRSSEESRTFLLFLKLRTKGSKKMLLQLGLAILFCYEKVVLSPPLLHPNPCLDIRVLSPWSSYSQPALALPSTGVLWWGNESVRLMPFWQRA